jgi:hypothetical protein
MSSYKFGSGSEGADSVVMITGVARSGTTILGKIVASLEGMDYEYEPWLLAQLPILAKQPFAGEMLRGYLSELFAAHLLGRSVNLRPSDDSRITRYQTEEELHYKWSKLSSRDDVKKFAKSKQRQMAVKMVNLQPFFPFLFKALPKLRIISIVRNPLDVALSIQKKGWFSEEELIHTESLSMKKKVLIKGKKKLLPWWAEDKEAERFAKLSDFSRALYCWRVLTEAGMKYENKNILEVRYEGLIENPVVVAEKIARFLGTKPGALTSEILATVDRSKPLGSQDYPLKEADPVELKKVLALMRQKGYGIPKKIPAMSAK